MIRRIIFFVITLAFLVALFFAYQKYQVFFKANVPNELDNKFIEIPTGSSFEEVIQLLTKNGFLIDSTAFRETAQWMNFQKPKMRAGRFEIQPNWNNQDLIRHLRAGKQATVKVVLTNERLPENVAAKVARFIEEDSLGLINIFNNRNYLEELGYTSETFMSIFIPNTYEFFWNTNAKEFMERMVKEHQKFWKKDNRLEKAKARNMTPKEVYTLASIVGKETNKNQEKKRMAGVYLNRLEKGIPLQADPTCVFATRDFNTRRVTNYHTQFDSPYNTYLYRGLPPGPIAMSSISSIDAVLNAEKHDYIYFCAKGDGTGFHSFAKTLKGHNQNAAIYKRNLRARGKR
jgi:UPF0755 protein